MSGSTSIGNNQRQDGQSNDPPPDDKSTLLPGDEVLPGSVNTGGDSCSGCGGSGKMKDGSECKDCSGTGTVKVSGA